MKTKKVLLGLFPVLASALTAHAQNFETYTFTTFGGQPSLAIADGTASGVRDLRRLSPRLRPIGSLTLSQNISGERERRLDAVSGGHAIRRYERAGELESGVFCPWPVRAGTIPVQAGCRSRSNRFCCLATARQIYRIAAELFGQAATVQTAIRLVS